MTREALLTERSNIEKWRHLLNMFWIVIATCWVLDIVAWIVIACLWAKQGGLSI